MSKTTWLWMAAFCATAAFPQKKVSHEGADGLQISSGKVDLVVLSTGGAFASFSLADDPKHTNFMWDPVRMARDAGARANFGPSKGHFLCVDGFGPVTRAEQAAGLSGHGEAHKQPWEVVSSKDTEATFRVSLPLVQEVLTRKVSVAPGEQVVLVESELESLLPFDRVMLWAEHATIGAPFLKLGKTVVNASSTECQTKPTRQQDPTTFPSSKDFRWPNIPTQSGVIDGQVSPAEHGSMNHIGCLMNPQREHQFLTAMNTDDNLMLGYLFPRQDYPWVQHWMNYPRNGTYAWGLEFGMQPYDMTKAEILALTPMFGAPTFRWLPAKSKVSTKFLMFATRVPAGFRHTDDVRLEGGKLIIEDKTAGKQISLAVTKGL